MTATNNDPYLELMIIFTLAGCLILEKWSAISGWWERLFLKSGVSWHYWNSWQTIEESEETATFRCYSFRSWLLCEKKLSRRKHHLFSLMSPLLVLCLSYDVTNCVFWRLFYHSQSSKQYFATKAMMFTFTNLVIAIVSDLCKIS